MYRDKRQESLNEKFIETNVEFLTFNGIRIEWRDEVENEGEVLTLGYVDLHASLGDDEYKSGELQVLENGNVKVQNLLDDSWSEELDIEEAIAVMREVAVDLDKL